jgi:DNA recombination protein RmuC
MDWAILLLSAAVVIAAALLAFALMRPRAAAPPDSRLEAVISGQGAIAEQFRQTIIAQAALAQQVDALKEKMGETLAQSATRTAETLGGIQTRLSVIDEAQKNISQLSGQVVSLQQVLSNKQARGAFGQTQMEEIVRDGLPPSLYDFQFTLSNRNRPDCIIRLPGNSAMIVIDSKFPLEGFVALREAAGDEERKLAAARIRGDVAKHVGDIAEKYLIPGEVQTPAIVFVPSESIYADLHDSFADVIQRAHRAQVMVVSPNILMLAINTIQTVMKDARMREQADLIRKEVGVLLSDVRRLGERVSKLQSHFAQTDADMKDIQVSTGKILSRGEKIEKVDLAQPDGPKSLS